MADDASLDLYQQMRQRLRAWMAEKGRDHRYADYLMSAPDLLHVLCKLAADPDVPVAKKAKLALAIAYFVSPADIIPEGLVGPVGYVDDIALAAYVLDDLVNETGEDVVRRHWAGDGDVLAVIRGILSVANEMVGAGVWARVKGMFGAGDATTS